MGDAQLSAEEAIHNYYMPALYTNFLLLIQDEQVRPSLHSFLAFTYLQDSNGTLTDTTPFTFGSRPADPAWGSAYPSIVYWVWKYYDDIGIPSLFTLDNDLLQFYSELVSYHYPSLKAYIAFLTRCYDSTGLQKFYYNYG